MQAMEDPLFLCQWLAAGKDKHVLLLLFLSISLNMLHSTACLGVAQYQRKRSYAAPEGLFCVFVLQSKTHPFFCCLPFYTFYLHHPNSNYDSQGATSSAVRCSARTICTEQCHTITLHLFCLLIICICFISLLGSTSWWNQDWQIVYSWPGFLFLHYSEFGLSSS